MFTSRFRLSGSWTIFFALNPDARGPVLTYRPTGASDREFSVFAYDNVNDLNINADGSVTVSW